MTKVDAPATGGRILQPHPSRAAAIVAMQPEMKAAVQVVAQAPQTAEFLIRLSDIIGSVIILILALPLMVISALLVKMTSAGPAFYKQGRVGQGGRPFILYKFRTMIDNAEEHVGPVWALPEDDRVTPVGRILRRMHVDELPQLLNILWGDMSLVGPRPERPFFVERHKALQGVRLAVKPGLTGLAQVRSYVCVRLTPFLPRGFSASVLRATRG